MEAASRSKSRFPHEIFSVLDPDQIHALRDLDQNGTLWVHGTDQSKRSEFGMQVIVHHLMRGKSILICADTENHRLIKEFMLQHDLSGLVFDVNRPLSREGMVNLQVARKKPGKDLAATLEAQLTENQLLIEGVETKYHNAETRVFGDLTWKQLVDKVSSGPTETYKSQLQAALDMADFAFTHQEYWHLKGRIKSFQRLRVLRTPAFDLLNAFHDSHFANEEDGSIKANILEQLKLTMSDGRTLLNNIGELVTHYRREVFDASRMLIEEHIVTVEQFLLGYNEAITKHGEDFTEESTFSDIAQKLKRSINRGGEEKHTDRNRIADQFREMHRHIMNSGLISRTEAGATREYPLNKMRERAVQLIEMLHEKIVELETQATHQKKRLNAQNLPKGHSLTRSILSLEKQIDAFVLQLNNARLFAERHEINALSLERKSQLIKQLVLKCKRLEEAMVDFEAYFLWRSFWSQQSSDAKMLLESLDILEDDDQSKAFDAWYLENILDVFSSRQIIGDSDLHTDSARAKELREFCFTCIKEQFKNRRHEAFIDLRKKNKGLTNAIKNGNYHMASEEFAILGAQQLSRFFPLVLCTPGNLRDYAYYFDTLMVFDTRGADVKAYQAQSQRCVLVTERLPANTVSLTEDINLHRLRVRQVESDFNWSELPASTKLDKLNMLTSLFLPFLSGLKIYNCKNVQVISALGPVCDKAVLNIVQLPYKEIDNHGEINGKLLTETFLDTRKPVIFLCRDRLIGVSQELAHIWQSTAIDCIQDHGLHVLHLWSQALRDEPVQALSTIASEVLRIANTDGRTVEEAALTA